MPGDDEQRRVHIDVPHKKLNINYLPFILLSSNIFIITCGYIFRQSISQLLAVNTAILSTDRYIALVYNASIIAVY